MSNENAAQAFFSRRDLLAMVGKVAGGSAMYHAMTSLGFAQASPYSGPVQLEGAPKGATILVLGAGVAGLVAAYELRNAGYQVKVLEYNNRAGGRAWTLRGGDEYTELGGYTQRCEFDKGLYINPGPWRIPYHHYGILDYAKRLNVPLEPFMQVNYNAYLHSKNAYGGVPQRFRHIHADFQGHISELLSKAVNKNQLDSAMTREDQEILREALKTWGALDKDYRYATGAASSVQFNAKVTKIEQGERGVTVTYTDAGSTGSVQQAKADWCVCTIPLSILSQIDVNVAAPMLDAIQAVPYEASVKVGLQFKRRFWEQDDLIYGGISYTDLPISMVSYPSTGFGNPGKGVMLGGYIWGPNAYEFTSLEPKERVRLAVHYGSKIHPQYLQEFETGVSVGWHRVPFTNGCFGNWSDAARAKHYKNLCQIDGRIVLAGEHASLIPAWQEGAVLSALDAITRLHAKIKSKA